MAETAKENQAVIRRAVEILSRGGTVVYPTETLYALGAIATNKEAVREIYLMKRRPQEKLLPVIVGSIKQAQRYFVFTRNDRKLAVKFWPGPLSLVLKARSMKLAKALGNNFLAVRYPANPLAAALARRSRAPIISTSANLSGRPGCFTVSAVKRQFAQSPKSEQPDLFVDGGRLKRSLPSTIVQNRGNKLLIIRDGAISLAKIL